MKKLFIFLAICLPAIAYGQDTASPYSLSLHAGYGHNLTHGAMANFDLESYLPIHQYFEAEANIRVSTTNNYAFGIELRPKFALPIGELYIEDRLLSNIVKCDDYIDFVHAISAGYRMQYVNVQVGMFSRILIPQPYTYHTGDEMISEPFNLMYRVEVLVRPETAPWNISLALSNVDTYQMERMWQPMFYLGGWYDVNDNWRVSINGKLKLAGMFHLNAHYYASEVKVGAQYRF